MKKTAILLITILFAIGMLLTVTGCDDSDNDNPVDPGNGTEIPDELYGYWTDASSSTQYRFTEDNVQFYLKGDTTWVLQYDYLENGYDIVYDDKDRVSIYLAEIYTIGFYIGENGNLYSDGADLFMTKVLVKTRVL